LRSIKSRSNGRKRQAPSNGNSYDQLTGDWALYYKVTSYFVRHIHYEDREDWLHDTMLEMAKVKAKYEPIGKPLTEAGLMRVASVTVADYWRAQYRLTNGLDCGSCSKAQRQKCRDQDLYSKCPKAIKLEYLSKPITDGDGNLTELGELIADNKAIDLDAWLDDKAFLLGCPQRLIDIAHKINEGQALDGSDRKYLCKWRKREQKRLL